MTRWWWMRRRRRWSRQRSSPCSCCSRGPRCVGWWWWWWWCVAAWNLEVGVVGPRLPAAPYRDVEVRQYCSPDKFLLRSDVHPHPGRAGGRPPAAPSHGAVPRRRRRPPQPVAVRAAAGGGVRRAAAQQAVPHAPSHQQVEDTGYASVMERLWKSCYGGEDVKCRLLSRQDREARPFPSSHQQGEGRGG